MMAQTAPYHGEIALDRHPARALWLTAHDNIRIRIGIKQANPARGTIVIMPGRTEYVEKYAKVSDFLADLGFNSVTIDWRGQGLADRLAQDPLLGHVGHFDDYQVDLASVMDWIKTSDLNGPIYSLAHSMGGCIGLRYILDNPSAFAGVFFSGPMWGIEFHPFPPFIVRGLLKLGPTLGKCQAYIPGNGREIYTQITDFSDNKLTNSAEMWDYMKTQISAVPALQLGGPSWHWLNSAIVEMDALEKRPSPNLPCYCLLGTNEAIVQPAPIHARMQNWASAKLDMIPQGRHETLMEPDDQVITRLTTGLKHIGAL